MEELFAALEQAFIDYRQDVEAYQRRSRPTDGLLGFGRSLKDDACHDRFDGRVKQAVDGICASRPSPEEAERTLKALLLRADGETWPLASQWMLRAVERHGLPLIPFLTREAAAGLFRAYAGRYRPWDRLPAQKEVCRALKAKSERL